MVCSFRWLFVSLYLCLFTSHGRWLHFCFVLFPATAHSLVYFVSFISLMFRCLIAFFFAWNSVIALWYHDLFPYNNNNKVEYYSKFFLKSVESTSTCVLWACFSALPRKCPRGEPIKTRWTSSCLVTLLSLWRQSISGLLDPNHLSRDVVAEEHCSQLFSTNIVYLSCDG